MPCLFIATANRVVRLLTEMPRMAPNVRSNATNSGCVAGPALESFGHFAKHINRPFFDILKRFPKREKRGNVRGAAREIHDVANKPCTGKGRRMESDRIRHNPEKTSKRPGYSLARPKSHS